MEARGFGNRGGYDPRDADTDEIRKVIAGPAGHWYALMSDWQFGETLIGLPMHADSDPNDLPQHPAETGNFDGWCDITDPAPGVDDAAIIAELKRPAVS